MSQRNKPPVSKIQPLLTAWHDNHGNLLLFTAVIVGILACIVGYFDLIPDIRTTGRSGFAPVLGGKTLEVRITGCQSDQGQVVAMLYEGQNFSEESVPIRIQNLEVEDGEAVWPIYNLAYGSYAVYAFHDIDVNDTVDPSNEPQGLSRSGKLSNQLSDEPSSFADAPFDFSASQTSITVQLGRKASAQLPP